MRELNNAVYVFPVEFSSLNSFAGVLFLLHLTQTESSPKLSVTVEVTETGQRSLRVFPIGVWVITGFTVSTAKARKLYIFDGAPRGASANLLRESLVYP